MLKKPTFRVEETAPLRFQTALQPKRIIKEDFPLLLVLCSMFLKSLDQIVALVKPTNGAHDFLEWLTILNELHDIIFDL